MAPKLEAAVFRDQTLWVFELLQLYSMNYSPRSTLLTTFILASGLNTKIVEEVMAAHNRRNTPKEAVELFHTYNKVSFYLKNGWHQGYDLCRNLFKCITSFSKHFWDWVTFIKRKFTSKNCHSLLANMVALYPLLCIFFAFSWK